MKIIGLDVGEKRIGVAKVDSGTRIAVPVGFVMVDGSEWQEIAKIANLNSTNFFVLGLPRSNEGNETQQSLYVRNFARALTEKVPGAKVRFQDESLTSVEAEDRLKQRKKKYEKGEIDAEAATIILQDFIEGFAGVAAAQSMVEVTAGAGAQEIAEHTTPDGGDGSTVVDGAKALAKTAKAKTEKAGEKVALNTKKVSHKLKAVLIISPIVLVLIVAAVVGVLFAIREQRARERAEWYAAQEAADKAEVFQFTILPGETIFDVKESLSAVGYSDAEIEAGFNADYDFEFLKDRPAGATLEGYLYGETYEFYADATVEDVLTKYLEGMGKIIAENALEEAYAAQGLTLYEGITLASVVQKEASGPEQPTVAQVFLSRLGYGWKLGSDVTVTYALDVLDPDRTTYTDNAAALAVDSCYNTRRYTGLPCGPISNPSKSALLAVAHPSDTAYLYFLTGDDGLMYYSYTEAEHNQKAYLYCKELCAISL
ncbi:endolytic transglycosylase MltG [Candidatus Saccharibacteria bacterium]|nr:endolytic transglycosylase MltG [Candidatus Saccharibacteria bacterium]